VPVGALAYRRVMAWVQDADHYCQSGKMAASPWVINSMAMAAMSSPMIWVKIRIPVRPISALMTIAHKATSNVPYSGQSGMRTPGHQITITCPAASLSLLEGVRLPWISEGLLGAAKSLATPFYTG
jgi:hypothetical protein